MSHSCQSNGLSTPSFPGFISESLLKLMPNWPMILSKYLILCHPLLFLPSIFPRIRVFSNENIRWPKYWNFNLSISSSNEYPGLISFVLTHLISVPSKGLSRIFSDTTVRKHQFFSAEILYGPAFTCLHDNWENHSINYPNFGHQKDVFGFNMLSTSVIAFLPSSKCLLIPWQWSWFTMILEPKKIKSVTVSTFAPSICHEVMGLDAISLVFRKLCFPEGICSVVELLGHMVVFRISLVSQMVKHLSLDQEDPLEKEMNPLQHFCLENPMNIGSWWATVQGGHKELDMSQLLHFHFHGSFSPSF